MKKMKVLKVHCCQPEKKCESCPAEWTMRYYIEIDDELEGEKVYTIFFPLMGMDDAIRSKVRYFNPLVTTDGVWYLAHEYVLKIYKNTEKYDALRNTVSILKKRCEELEKLDESGRKDTSE